MLLYEKYILIFIVLTTLFFIWAVKTFGSSNIKSIFDFKKDVKKSKNFSSRQREIEYDKTLIGTTGKKEIFIPNNAKHIFVCGTTGSGKTVALANFIESGIKHDYPLLIVDGKGDTNDNSIMDVVQKLSSNRKLYIINLNNPQSSMKYNPFKNTSPTVIKDMLINMTEWSEEHYKLNTERYLQRLISLIEKSETPSNFKNIIGNMEINKFNALSAVLLKNEKITKEEHLNNVELSKNCEKIIEGATARFSSLYESEIGQIFDDEGIDIYTAIKEKAIILFILNPLLYPEISPLFGNLIVIDSKKAVSKLFNDRHKRIFFIFDEINVYASLNFLDLVNKSRSANITCVLATQSLSDLNAVDENFKEQVIENCNNYIVLRQNSAVNAENWSKIIGTRNKMDVTYQINESGSTGLGSARQTREFLYHPDDIKNLKTGNAIYISKDNQSTRKINVRKCF